MASYTNVQNLNTYLSTVVAGAPATTATSLLNGLTPVFYNFTGDTTPHYGVGTPTAINTLSGTQGKYSAILYPSSGTPIGVTMGDCIGLLAQGLKETNAIQGLLSTFTVTTAANGTFSLNITSLGLTNPPRVMVTPTNNSVPQTVNAQVTSKTNTAVNIYTTVTQQVLLGIVNPTTPIASSVDVFVYSLG